MFGRSAGRPGGARVVSGAGVVNGARIVNGAEKNHLIEAAKRGRLDQMFFFSAPLTTRAPPGRPAERPNIVAMPFLKEICETLTGSTQFLNKGPHRTIF